MNFFVILVFAVSVSAEVGNSDKMNVTKDSTNILPRNMTSMSQKRLQMKIIFGGFIYAEIGNSNPMNDKDLSKNFVQNVRNIFQIPPSLVEKHEDIREEIKMTLADKCRENGGEEALFKAHNAITELKECMQNLFSLTEIQEKIQASKPFGNLDEVFRKYCMKIPIMKQCIRNATTGFDSCLQEKERENVWTTLNITDSVLDFICYKEGDRIALFFAEEGSECLVKSNEEIRDCVNKTFGITVPKKEPTIETLPSLVLSEKNCLSLKEMQTCIVSQMVQNCEEPTPPNIVDSLFKFIIRGSPCANYIRFHD